MILRASRVDCGNVRVDYACSRVKGERTDEIPSKTRERDTEKQKTQWGDNK